GIFAEDRYFDVQVEYAKASPTDMVVRITATNRGPERAPLHVLPTLWFRNTWSWATGDSGRPLLRQSDPGIVEAQHAQLGTYWLACDRAPELLFTENESNAGRLWGIGNHSPYVKDGINDAIVNGRAEAVNPDRIGTKAAAHYRFEIDPGETRTMLLRLSDQDSQLAPNDAEPVIALRQAEADA